MYVAEAYIPPRRTVIRLWGTLLTLDSIIAILETKHPIDFFLQPNATEVVYQILNQATKD